MAQQSQDVIRVNVFYQDPAMVVADAHRLFAKEGLSAEVTVTPDSTVQMQGLRDGTWHVAVTAFDNVLAWSGRDGVELVTVAQFSFGLSLPVLARPEVHAWEDLRGRPLAADAVDTAFALVLRRILLEHGLDYAKGDYQLVPVGATGARLESMKRGDTFAGILNPPVEAQGIAAGLVRLGDQSEVLPEYPGPIAAVERQRGRAARNLIVRFLRARARAARWIYTHQSDAIALVAERTGTPPPSTAALLRNGLSDGRINRAGLQSSLDLRVDLGLLPVLGSDLTAYVTEEYAAAAGIG